MKTKLILSVASFCLLGLCPATKADDTKDFFFHDKDDPIVFLGDSITAQAYYSNYIEAFVLTRFPDWKVSFRNIGLSGDAATFTSRGGFENGMNRDVLPLHAKAILIEFGMNSFDEKCVECTSNMVQQLKAAGTRIALISSTPEENYEAGQPAGRSFNVGRQKYAESLKAIATREGTAYVDQLAPFIKYIEEGRKAGVLGTTGAKDEPRLTYDGVHPTPAGHLVMADEILKGLGAPSLVSNAEIDATTHATVLAENCQIDWLGQGPAELKFRRLDKALPWPILADSALALKLPGFDPMEDLNRYMLKVINLTAPSYDLSIDDQNVGTFTKEELGKGVNLAMRAGPITEQSQKVYEAVAAITGNYSHLFIGKIIPAWKPGTPSDSFLAQFSAQIDDQVIKPEAALAELRKPRPHIFTLMASAQK